METIERYTMAGINLKVPNFFWATFFILHDPLELSTGACATPSGTEIVKTHHCVVGAPLTHSKPV